VNPGATPVPFAFTFTPGGRLASVEAGASSLTTYQVGGDGTLTDPKSASDGQTAACWIRSIGALYVVGNTGSNDLSTFTVDASGQPSLLAAVAATTDPGPIDLARSGDTLYAETGLAGTVDEFRIGSGGGLTPIGSVDDLPPGLEGIAAS
jgi:6-phosphogluconolactonase (cycloisomerase 2 family)